MTDGDLHAYTQEIIVMVGVYIYIYMYGIRVVQDFLHPQYEALASVPAEKLSSGSLHFDFLPRWEPKGQTCSKTGLGLRVSDSRFRE